MENSVRILRKFPEIIKKSGRQFYGKIKKSTEKLAYFKTSVAHKVLKALFPFRDFYP